MVKWLGLSTFIAGARVQSWSGNKIPQATQHSQKIKHIFKRKIFFIYGGILTVNTCQIKVLVQNTKVLPGILSKDREVNLTKIIMNPNSLSCL